MLCKLLYIVEYCTFETFQPKCASDEIILMQHAVYGRMSMGKCLRSDNYIGCWVDALHFADRTCSGRESCGISIPSADMNSLLTCLDNGLTAYLEAAFYCQTVYIPSTDRCTTPQKVQLYEKHLRISSEISKKTRCGLYHTPLVIEAKQGQKLNINMLDFAWENGTTSLKNCPFNYGYILDMENNDVINICGGENRDKLLYQSIGKNIQVILEIEILKTNRFLLQIEVVGCPEYTPPSHTWLQKNNDSLTVGCIFSSDTWTVQCIANRWIGMIGNCTKGTDDVEPVLTGLTDGVVANIRSSAPVPNISNNHVIIFTLACVTLLTCSAIIILGVFCTKRYQAKIRKYTLENSSNVDMTATYGEIRGFDESQSCMMPSNPGTSFRQLTSTPHGTFLQPVYNLPLVKTGSNVLPRIPKQNNNFVMHKDICKKKGNIKSDSGGYDNIAETDTSAQYFILDNQTESSSSNGSEAMYQSIHINDSSFLS